MSTFTDLEKDAASVDGFANENGLIPTRRNGPKPSWQYLVDGWNAEIDATILELNKSRGFRVVGKFADGFTYELFNDVGIDADGNSWIYVGDGAPNKVVAAGTVPSSPDYEQVTYGTASSVFSNDGNNLQYHVDDIDGFTSALLDDAGIVPNGLPDTATSSQRLDALKVLIDKPLKRFDSVQDMIDNSTPLIGDKYSTGSTSWLVNSSLGIDLGGGLFARPLNGIWLSDFVVDETGVDAIDYELEQALLAAETGGFKVNARGGNAVYLTTRQHTVRHNTSLNFNGARVNFVQITSNNDSPFQMGSNTELKNISKGTYNSTSTSVFSTLGWVKVGEFYALLDGDPSAGDNSIDETYWEPDNVLVENVYSDMSEQETEDSRGFGKTVGHYSATNCTYKNIGCDGLCQDGKPSKHTMSTVRTETGVDINSGRQGYNIIIENIKGKNLRAQAENAVVYVNGDRNTHVKNVHGESCGAILGLRPNRLISTQDQSMHGRSGLNILAENITGINCRKEATDTSANTLSAMYIHSNEGDVLSNNKSSFIVRNVALFSTDVIADKLPLGMQIGDPIPFPAETTLGARRVTVDGFEIVGFIDGLNEEEGCRNNEIKNGFARMCDKNGGNLNGTRSTYRNIKSWRNNQGAQPDANNGHGFRIACKQGVFINCDFGDESLGAGNETQKSALYIAADDTTARLNNCHFDNYQTGETVLGSRSVTGANVYVDQFCTSKGVTLTKAIVYHLSPDVVKAAAVFNAAGSTQFQLECTVAKGAVGKYDVTFDKPMANTDYRVVATSNFQYSLMRVTLKTVNGFQISSKNDSGVDTDTGFDFNVYGDYSTVT